MLTLKVKYCGHYKVQNTYLCMSYKWLLLMMNRDSYM